MHLLGGEPLYQKEFYRCLDYFKTSPNSDLEFNFVTNLMISPSKFEQLVDQMKSMTVDRNVKRFDITVSLDCWGVEQEYARWGLQLDTIEANINTLLKTPWIYLNINSTLSPLTIKKFPELIEKINTWKTQRKIQHHFQTVFYPEYHNPDIFGLIRTERISKISMSGGKRKIRKSKHLKSKMAKAQNTNLHKAKQGKNDEFYTQLCDIENEMRHYKEHFRGKTVLCNCDLPHSNFVKYFQD